MLRYADDNKISPIKLEVVKKIARKLEEKFSGILSVSCRLKHDFLEMKIAFTSNRQAYIGMREYLQKALDALREEDLKPVSSSARSNLFEVDSDLPELHKGEKKNL